MKTGKQPQPSHQHPGDTGDSPLHRSGAVARMLRMPVATLRVWERRYALTRPALSPSGQRLYKAGWLEAIDVAAHGLAAVPKAVLYGFASTPLCEALATVGTALLREPQPDAVLAQWLHSLSMVITAPQPEPGRAAFQATA